MSESIASEEDILAPQNPQTPQKKVPVPSKIPGHYSGANPIPTIKEFIDKLDSGKQERDEQINKHVASTDKSAKNTDEQDFVPPALKHTSTELSAKKGQKIVTDPVTGSEIVIENAKKSMIKEADNPKLVVPNANLGKETTIKTDPSQSGEEYRYNQDVTAPPEPVEPGSTTDVPIHGEKTNILFHPTPSVSYEATFKALENQATGVCVGVFLSVIVLGKIFGGKFIGLIPLSMCLTSGIWLWMKEVVRSGREVEWDSEKKRGQFATANLLPESVEWLNTMLSVSWGMINPEMFTVVADTLEDVMQASMPSVISNIKIPEISQGSNPIRILSLRSLPDSHVQDMKDYAREQNSKIKDEQEVLADEEGGDYYNLEVAFAYHALPSGSRQSDKARNMHMSLCFYLGIKGFFGVPFPVFVELQRLVGTVRLRLQITSEPPFLKTLTFTLAGVPHVQAGCIPMFEKGVNILNLPLISNFVNYAIGAAASMYVAPKSMQLDMRSILQGDDITKDVHALGIVWIRIHRALGLSKQDRTGSKHGGSDPYITLAFSKYGKPMYCTRVITDDLNPIFEESLALLVTPELIQANENLSVELWDSDRHSADDIVGKVEVSLQKMIQHPSKMFPQVSRLSGLDSGTEMPGQLHWEIGYFSKPNFRPALRTDGKNAALPDALKNDEKFQDAKGIANSEEEAHSQDTPPDPLWPSGIVSIIVHQIVNLELENIKGTSGSRKNKEFEPAKPYGESKEESGGNLPTSYCTICLNDELIYRTRSKAVSSQPIFNAGTERFIRNWKSAIVTVTVRDQRNRQHDPILGVVPLRLSEILDNKSQVTRWYPLDGGIGFGRMRVSLLFRSVELNLTPNMLGWDVGTFEFSKEKVQTIGYKNSSRIKMRTGGSVGHISKDLHSYTETGCEWDLNKENTPKIQLPVKYRYRSPIVFEFFSSGRRKPDAYATYWLHQLTDNEEAQFDIPIWTTKSPARLIQNFITENNCKNEPGLEDLKEIGRFKFSGRFKTGMDESHGEFISDNDSRETYETFEACLAEGVREKYVEAKTPPQIQILHEKSLKEGRDVLSEDDKDTKHAKDAKDTKDSKIKKSKQWESKDGSNWSGAFGHDPLAYLNSKEQKVREPGVDEPLRDPYHPHLDEDYEDKLLSEDEDHSDSDPDLIVGEDELRSSMGTERTDTTLSSGDYNKQNKRTEQRKQRGLNQWKPVRNVVFAKNQSKIGLQKLKKRITGGLDGRQPGIETEIGN